MLERRIKHRVGQCAFLHEVECLVERVEEDDHQAYDEGSLEKGEQYSEEFVQPVEHHQFQYFLKQFSEKSQNYEYADENECEGCDLEYFAGCIDVLSEPSPRNVGKLERDRDADYNRYDCNHLADKAFLESLHESRYEAY